MEVLLTISLVLLLLLALLLLTKKSLRYKANLYLTFGYGSLAYVILYSLCLNEHHVFRYSHFIFLYLTGPSQYAHVVMITQSKFSSGKMRLIHFLLVPPAVVYYVYHHLVPNTQNPAGSHTLLPLDGMVYAMGLVSLLFYGFLVHRLVTRHHALHKAAEREKENWIKTVFLILAALGSILFVLSCEFELHPRVRLVLGSLICLLLIALSMQQFHHPDLFYVTRQNAPAPVKYANSMLTNQQLDLYHTRLMVAMESGHYHLRCDLTRDQLARELRISPHHLSQVLSQRIGKNFHDFVNEYRVRSVQECFKDPQNDRYTIEAIVRDCGFANRAILSRAFRKQIGLSPEESRKNIQANR